MVPMTKTTRQVGTRLEESLITRLDAYARTRAAETPGQTVTRTDAMRVLLEKGLSDAGFPRPAARKKR